MDQSEVESRQGSQQSNRSQQQGRKQNDVKFEKSEGKLQQFIDKISSLNEEIKDKYQVIENKEDENEELLEKCDKQRKEKLELEQIIREKKELLDQREQQIARMEAVLAFDKKYYDDQLEMKFEEIEQEEIIKKDKFKQLEHGINHSEKLMYERVQYLEKQKEQQASEM